MAERNENSVQFSLLELANIESDRQKREQEDRKRREEEDRLNAQAEERRRKEAEIRAKAAEAERAAREEAERKALVERERLEVELAAQRAKEEVERKSAIERARLEAQKRGKPFDPNAVFNQPPPKSNGALIGSLSALAAVVVGGIVYFAAFRDDGVVLQVPSPTIAIKQTIVETKIETVVKEVPGAPTGSAPKRPTGPSNPKPANTDAPKKKQCPKSDPLCGLDL